MAALVERFRQEFPRLISGYRFDSFGTGYNPRSPVKAVARTLLVPDTRETRKGSIRRAVHSLQGVGAYVVGATMNNARAERTTTTGTGRVCIQVNCT